MRDTTDDAWMNREDEMVTDALREVGIAATSVYDLVNTRTPYPEAIPVLIDMLPKVRHEKIKEGVARALAAKEARVVAAKPLIQEFANVPSRTFPEEHAKWAIGNALTVVADDSVFEEIVGLVSDKRHGWTRSALALTLCNMKKHREEAVAKLMELLDDEDVGVQAMMALGRLRVKEARSGIERYLHDSDPWVRREAKRALAKIDKGK